MAAADDTDISLTYRDVKLSFYEKKYFSLRKRCEHIQQSNEKLVNRIQHVKKLVRRYTAERRALQDKLEEHGDNYRDTKVPLLVEGFPPASAAATIGVKEEPVETDMISIEEASVEIKMEAEPSESHPPQYISTENDDGSHFALKTEPDSD